jgi:hypothetical protein
MRGIPSTSIHTQGRQNRSVSSLPAKGLSFGSVILQPNAMPQQCRGGDDRRSGRNVWVTNNARDYKAALGKVNELQSTLGAGRSSSAWRSRSSRHPLCQTVGNVGSPCCDRETPGSTPVRPPGRIWQWPEWVRRGVTYANHLSIESIACSSATGEMRKLPV